MSVLSFMACTGLKEPDEAPGGGSAGDENDAGAGRGGSQQSGSGGAAGDSVGGDGATVGGAGAGGDGYGNGGAGDGGAGGSDQPPVVPCASAVEPTGETYYFCACDDGADTRCEPGSDSPTGTNPAAP